MATRISVRMPTATWGRSHLPKSASRKGFKARSCDGTYELSFKFIGNDYPKLRVSQEIVFMNPYSARAPPNHLPPGRCSGNVGIASIWRGWGKEKAKQYHIGELRGPV